MEEVIDERDFNGEEKIYLPNISNLLTKVHHGDESLWNYA
jgi:hypothetical protein